MLWVVLAPLLAAAQYAFPALTSYVWPISCYFALACGVIAHNHNHCPTFASRTANHIFSNWISVFYGYPTFAWIPTHNMNHHKYVNRAGDATITWRHSDKHNLLVAATYFFVSSYWQSVPIGSFIRKAKEKNPSLYRQIIFQYVFFITAHVGLAALAIVMYGVSAGLYLYAMTFLLPAVFALWTIMLFNYEQHVHTDPWSDYNHSRNWDGRLLNFFLFNNGLHTAHHEIPGMHWSKLRSAHDEIAPHIDPRLIHRSICVYFIRQYVMAPFLPAVGTQQVGRAPSDPPHGRRPDLEIAEVEAGDAGTNAQMVRG